MGGDAQPQVLLQLLARLLHHGQDPGATIGAPRWSLIGSGASGFDTWAEPDGATVAIENTAPAGWGTTLRACGHEVTEIDGVFGSFGHAHVIEVTEDGLAGAADPRALIGAAAGY
jgi:gamma-glutamyltranspeptidase/glutathione hydrolase